MTDGSTRTAAEMMAASAAIPKTPTVIEACRSTSSGASMSWSPFRSSSLGNAVPAAPGADIGFWAKGRKPRRIDVLASGGRTCLQAGRTPCLDARCVFFCGRHRDARSTAKLRSGVVRGKPGTGACGSRRELRPARSARSASTPGPKAAAASILLSTSRRSRPTVSEGGGKESRQRPRYLFDVPHPRQRILGASALRCGGGRQSKSRGGPE